MFFSFLVPIFTKEPRLQFHRDDPGYSLDWFAMLVPSCRLFFFLTLGFSVAGCCLLFSCQKVVLLVSFGITMVLHFGGLISGLHVHNLVLVFFVFCMYTTLLSFFSLLFATGLQVRDNLIILVD